VAIAGSNTASFTMNTGGSAYVGGTNSGNLTVSGGPGTLAVIGANSGAMTLSNGGSVYLGSGTTASLTASGGTAATLAINGNTSGTLSLNDHTTLSLNGSNTGTIQLNGGALIYSGSAGNVTNVNGGTQTQQSALNLTAPTSTLGNFATTFQIPLTALSTQLNGLAANSTATLSSGNVNFHAKPDSTGVAVFDVNTSLFAGASSVTFSLGSATSVIINVNVDSCVSNVCVFSPGSLNFTQGAVQRSTDYASIVLWNFVNATTLNLTNEFVGSILAPKAAVTNANAIDGTLVAASDTSFSTGELHSHPYTGSFPGTPTAAPEPASLIVLGSGCTALVVLHRRRRHHPIAASN